MKDWASWLIRRGLRVCACITVVFLLNCPSELALAQQSVPSLIALEKYLNEECDVTTRKNETCGVKRLIPYKNDNVLKQRLLQILTSNSDRETVQMAERVIDKQWEIFQGVAKGSNPSTITRDTYSEQHLDRILRIYHEKAVLGLATIDPVEATQLLADADQKGDQVLGRMLRFALSRHP